MNKEMTMAKYSFLRYTLNGIIWILIATIYSIVIFIDSMASKIISLGIMILAIILSLYILRIERPKSDEMAEKNMLRAESTSYIVTGIILGVLGFVFLTFNLYILDVVHATEKTLSLQMLCGLGCVAVWVFLGIRDLLVGIFFNKYEEGDDNEWEDD